MIRKLFFFCLPVFAISFGAPAQTIQDALSKKDSTAVFNLIKNGADINAPDANGTSVLMTACRWADDWTVSFLLRHGATADKPRSPKGRTPLMIASAYYGGKGICSMLIEHGADVNAATDRGITSLMFAAQNAKLDVVELLLKKGAKPQTKDANGKTALDYANNAEVTDYLRQSVKDCRIDKQATIDLLKKSIK